MDAVLELADEAPGDLLIFFAGEREIRDAEDALTDLVAKDRRLTGTEILPLFARLSMAEQHRVFSRGSSRRIVLATNVAETSLTVPRIRYVVDPGQARVKRYSPRLKLDRLHIEDISQVSANQRAGRCGRIADGVCIRLYDEADFGTRARFTDPEILRSSLAGVILRMKSLRLTDVESFPFIEPPDSRQITDGVRLLQELQAFDTETRAKGARRLTPTGRTTRWGSWPVASRRALTSAISGRVWASMAWIDASIVCSRASVEAAISASSGAADSA